MTFSESLTRSTAFHVLTPNIANENTPVTIKGPFTCQSIIVYVYDSLGFYTILGNLHFC